MTATIAKTSKMENTQPGPYESWTIGELVDVIARKAAS